MTLKTFNPATGKLLKEYPTFSASEIRSLLEDCRETQQAWSEVPVRERAGKLRQLSHRLQDRRAALAGMITAEMGKPAAEASAEVQKCSWVCDYYADNAAEFLAPRVAPSSARESRIHFRPLGVVLAIMPWNYPLWQVFRFAAPNLAAGNGAVLKHAENVTGCALEVERLFVESGIPEDLFRVLRASPKQVESVVRRAEVAAVTLTGGEDAGRKIARQAGSELKKTVLELGGSDAYILLRDAPVARAVDACVRSRLKNSGQSCIAAKRFVVVPEILEAFEESIVTRFEETPWGPPTDIRNEVGPLARADVRDELHEQVRQSIDDGARLLTGGTIPDREGYYYPPTVLTGVTPGMRVFDEETFGPVAAIVPAEDEHDAVELSNRSSYGLGGAIFTRDIAHGRDLAVSEIESGVVFINDQVDSDPRLPFGGVKDSGYGRELGEFGIREFVNVKTVAVA